MSNGGDIPSAASASTCLFGKLISATLCTRSLVHHARARSPAATTPRGRHPASVFPTPWRHTPRVSFTTRATLSSAFFAVSSAALACGGTGTGTGTGVDGRTERKSSGRCEAPASAVSDTAAARGPSEESMSSEARSGEDWAGLKTGARSNGVACPGRGVVGLGAAAGAAVALESFAMRRI